MPTLRSVLKPEETITITIGGERVQVTYRPQFLTPAFEAALKGLAEEPQASASFRAMFRGLIVSWDLRHEEDDPEPIPVTEEGLHHIPYAVLSDIMAQVQEHISPNVTTGPSSADGSLPAASLGASPTGTSSSGRRATSASRRGT